MSFLSKSFPLAAPLALIAALSGPTTGHATEATAPGFTTLFDGSFSRVPAIRDTGRSVAQHCQIGAHMSPDHWADAKAHLVLSQNATGSQVIISVEGARPDTLFTVWLMLSGGSPLMTAGATALIHSDEIGEAVALIGAPSTHATNGFTTDAHGAGQVSLTLDYPIIGGAFPFQRYDGFDASHPAFTRDTPKAIPVAIADAASGAPFTLRLASHCGDNLHNGLVAGQHEPWFDWIAQ